MPTDSTFIPLTISLYDSTATAGSDGSISFRTMAAHLGRAEHHAVETLLHEFADAGGDGFGDLAGELRGQGEEAAAFVAFDVAVDGVFRAGVEGDAVDDVLLVAVLAADGAGEAVADGFGEHFDVLGLGGPFAEDFEDRFEIADRHAFAEEVLQDFLQFAGLDLGGDDFFDEQRGFFLELFEEGARLLRG